MAGRAGAAVALAMVAAVIAYAPALRAPFLFDDGHAIANNASIRQLWPASVPLHPPSDTPVAGRPIANYSLALSARLDTWLAGDGPHPAPTPLGFHLGNLFLHLIGGLLVFQLVRRTLRAPRTAAWWSGAPLDANAAGALVAAVWLLHPLQTEAVNYLTQRTELLVACFYLATLWAATRAWDAPPGRSPVFWSVVAVACCLLGMGSKEVMVSAPLMVVLYDRAFLADRWHDLRRRLPLYAGLALTLIWLAILAARGARRGTAGFSLGVSPAAYLWMQAWAIARYLRLTLFPSPLVLDYGTRLVTGWTPVPGALLLLALGCLTLLAWRRPNRWGWAGFLGAWFFLILAPSSSIVPIVTEVAAERRMYLPLAAVIVAVMVGLEAMRRRVMSAAPARAWRRRVIAGSATLCLALSAATLQRSMTYRDPETLWRGATEQVPDNPRAWESRAIALWDKDPARVADVEAYLRKAIAIDSTFTTAYLNLSEIERIQGRDAAARTLLERSVRMDPTDVDARAKLGALLLDAGDVSHAIPELERGAAAGGEQATAVLARGYMVAGRYDDAVAAFGRVLAMDPQRLDVLLLVGQLFIEQNHAAEALPYLDRAVAIAPRSAVAMALLGLAYAGERREEDAVRTSTRAAASANGDTRVLLFAGRAMLEVRHLAEADAYLAEAARLAPDDPEVLTALGLTKVSIGDRGTAAALFRRALSIDSSYAPAHHGLALIGGGKGEDA